MMDHFEQSADMRLLELRRKALGKDAPPVSVWSGSPDTRDTVVVEPEAPPSLAGARLNVDIAATPKSKLIPGAVVTMTLAIHNIGDTSVDQLLVAVPIPGEAVYRPGSLQMDQRTLSESDADAFFGRGFTISKASAGQRIGFAWKISISPGTQTLAVSPHVLAEGAGIAGGTPVLMTRGAAPSSARLPTAYEPPREVPERPFYELDATEELEAQRELLASAAAPEPPLIVMPDIREELPQPALSVPAPAEQPLEPRLYCTFDAASLNVVKKLFAAESFGQVPHYILQNALACSLGNGGRDFGLRAHLSQQAGLLSRALLMRKLNKPMHVGDFATGKSTLELASALEAADPTTPSALYMQLTQADIDFCGATEQRNPLESFIRIRQIAVALQAQHVITEDESLQTRAQRALSSYAAAARAGINRTFIRAKLDKNFDPFGAVDQAADKLAHELIDILGTLVGA